MRLILALILLGPATAAAQAPDTLAARPSPEDALSFAPLQTSAPVAYLASVGATGLLVGTGLLLDAVLPEPPDSAYDNGTHLLYDAGTLVAAVGVLLGPSVGNLTLGAGDDVGRAYVFKAAGVVGGGGLLLLALGSSVGCVADVAAGVCRAGEPLLVASIAALTAGIGLGTVYDLATIPRNAARARAADRGLTVRAVGGLARGGPTVGLRATW